MNFTTIVITIMTFFSLATASDTTAQYLRASTGVVPDGTTIHQLFQRWWTTTHRFLPTHWQQHDPGQVLLRCWLAVLHLMQARAHPTSSWWEDGETVWRTWRSFARWIVTGMRFCASAGSRKELHLESLLLLPSSSLFVIVARENHVWVVDSVSEQAMFQFVY